MAKRRKRSQFVDHAVQRDYLRIVLIAMFVPMLVVGGCLYYLIWQTVANELLIPELIHGSLAPAYNRVNQVLIIALPVVCLTILWIAAMLSHRIAGPLYRIEQDLDRMIATSDFSRPIRVRKHDKLKGLADRINRAIRIATTKQS